MLSATIAVASLVVHALLKQMFKHRKPVIFTKKKFTMMMRIQSFTNLQLVQITTF